VVVWAGARTKYFLSAVLTGTQRTGTLGMIGDKEISQVGWSVTYPFSGDPRMVRDDYVLYTGPQDMQTLREYGVGLDKTIDLGWMPVLSKPALRLLIWMYSLIPNYGVVIIVLSVLTKILFYRLSHKSFKSMKDMQRLQPRLKALQDKYKDDKNRLNQETMKLYKEAGVNPLGGCLPMLLQMPVFIALFGALRFTIELRNAPFMLWIQDLSSPDVLFDFGFKLPMLGSEFHLLPLMMGAGMFLQSKLSGGSPTGEPATGTASQQKMMQTLMPIVFTVLFYNMPSGLVLYWFVNQVFSALQQYWVHRQIEAEDAVATREA
jgi:YidC/Oxa1 family membrane protein insertase